MKKTLSIVLALLMVMGTVFAAGGKDATEIYFLNFKPEVAEIYENEVVPAFEAANPGYKLKVVTAASGTYESTLTAELDKDNAPTLFQINGAVGYNSWKNSCLDLISFFSKFSGSKLAYPSLADA